MPIVPGNLAPAPTSSPGNAPTLLPTTDGVSYIMVYIKNS